MTAHDSAVSMRRKAMEDFSFNGNVEVKGGDWVCVPQRALMRDPLIYSSAPDFEGFRYSERRDLDSGTIELGKYTDLHPLLLFWGLGKQAW